MFQTANEFSMYIEKWVAEDKTITHVDAILKYCSDNQIEPEDLKSLINKSLKAKMKIEYQEMNYFKKDETTKL